eukprot:COSAG06_NODE_1786_length_8400_cov_4.794121_10_plen_199_part_00
MCVCVLRTVFGLGFRLHLLVSDFALRIKRPAVELTAAACRNIFHFNFSLIFPEPVLTNSVFGTKRRNERRFRTCSSRLLIRRRRCRRRRRRRLGCYLRGLPVCDGCGKHPRLFGVFLAFVPSLSWHIVVFSHKKIGNRFVKSFRFSPVPSRPKRGLLTQLWEASDRDSARPSISACHARKFNGHIAQQQTPSKHVRAN